MSEREDNRSYSLNNLEEVLEDAIISDCTPEEIYDTIRTTVRRNLTYHKMCVRTANQLLTLINGTEHKDKVINIHQQELDNYITDSSKWPDYTELPEKENNISYQDMIDAGYEMTGDGIWWPKDEFKVGEPDYNNPRGCAEIDSKAGDNRN